MTLFWGKWESIVCCARTWPDIEEMALCIYMVILTACTETLGDTDMSYTILSLVPSLWFHAKKRLCLAYLPFQCAYCC